MSAPMKTPGVYIQELDAFGNSVVPVPTAVPAFVGYTGKTSFNGKSLLNKAVKVTSLAEFFLIFGEKPPQVQFQLSKKPLLESYQIANAASIAATAALTVANDALTALKGKPGTATDPAAAQTELEAAQKALAADEDSNKAQLTAAVTAASALLNQLQAAASLAAISADKDVKTLIDAQTAVTKAGTGVTDAQTKALNAAIATLAATKEDADFCINDYAYILKNTCVNYRMWSAVKFFYENGGGSCYIMSIGAYDYTKQALTNTDPFTQAFTLLEKEAEPTMLLVPDAIEIKSTTAKAGDYADLYQNAYSLQNAMINHCGNMMSRVAILDIPGGYEEPLIDPKPVDVFRDQIAPSIPKFYSYAATYYPWLHTTVYQTPDITIHNLTKDSYALIAALLTTEFTDPKKGLDKKMAAQIATFTADSPSKDQLDAANLIFSNLSKSYQMAMGGIMKIMNLMGPSNAMAGIYTAVDNNEGVWVAPANVGVQSCAAPAINIDHKAQEDLNVPVSGKAICAIRAFTGRGNLVWGARTLDGNSNDWRYVNVRRTLIFIEQSIQDATKAYVFAPNDAGTWVNVSSMISNFLTGLWKQGGLVGPKPADAFSVSVGLGSTMTGDDILNGIMRVAIKVAVSRPAEFIELTFQQQMQKG